MKTYDYMGYFPYGDAQRILLEKQVEKDFQGNITKNLLQKGALFRLDDTRHAAMVLPDNREILFVKKDF